VSADSGKRETRNPFYAFLKRDPVELAAWQREPKLAKIIEEWDKLEAIYEATGAGTDERERILRSEQGNVVESGR